MAKNRFLKSQQRDRVRADRRTMIEPSLAILRIVRQQKSAKIKSHIEAVRRVMILNAALKAGTFKGKLSDVRGDLGFWKEDNHPLLNKEINRRRTFSQHSKRAGQLRKYGVADE